MVERFRPSEARRKNLQKTKINPGKNLQTATVSDQRMAGMQNTRQTVVIAVASHRHTNERNAPKAKRPV